jgi:signal transduction histidine kinase
LVFEPLLNKKGNILKKEINLLPQINGNANMLTDALINLLYNANNHTKDGVISVKWTHENAADTERICVIAPACAKREKNPLHGLSF